MLLEYLFFVEFVKFRNVLELFAGLTIEGGSGRVERVDNIIESSVGLIREEIPDPVLLIGCREVCLGFRDFVLVMPLLKNVRANFLQ